MTRHIFLLALLGTVAFNAAARGHILGTGRTQTSQPEECKRLCAEDPKHPGAIASIGETMRQNTCVCTQNGVTFYPSNRDLVFGEQIGISWGGPMSQDRIVGKTEDLAVPPFEGHGSSNVFMDDDSSDNNASDDFVPTTTRIPGTQIPDGEKLLFAH